MPNIQLTDEEMNRVSEAFAHVPFIQLLSITLGEVTRGTAILHMEARPELTQNSGIVHGGAIASLLDTASAFAVTTLLAPNQTTATVDLTIHYLRAIREGQITAHARVLRAGRRLTTVAIDVTDTRETLHATALTSYIING
jgi:uncharacterized protein (TIGR00369 family)